IGGKDSMSGTFENIDVPPTLVSFAVATGKVDEVITPEFKKANSKVVFVKPKYDQNGLPNTQSLTDNYKAITKLMREGKVLSSYTMTFGGIAEAIFKMCIGNGFGFKFEETVELQEIFAYNYGAFLLEVENDVDFGEVLGYTTEEEVITYKKDVLSIKEMLKSYEDKLEPIYSCNIKAKATNANTYSFENESKFTSSIKVAKPKVLIPVFPGTNCEYDTAKVFEDAGAKADIFVIKNLNSDDVAKSVEEFSSKCKESQIVFIPGGFSGGDEPDGSGKFITAFFRNEMVKEQIKNLLENRDGLMGGICNGFQALVKLGLVPYGKIIDTDENCPTLTYNDIARHQSKIVRIRIASNKSPWLSQINVGDVFNVPISHGEGKFIATEEEVKAMAKNGQIMSQYVDFDNNATMDIRFNPNGSKDAIEGILSPDGRVFGKMGHSERKGYGLYKNVAGEYEMKLFESAVKYFK
ncbi:MAG: phosphoribosylformylglycinamidine synthase subunit PurQ, partial [Clostridia bacterium]|nr:phosphoribosylformylglycinamidine synthase subunit PurQ [Clostridia bacterium]